MSIPPVLFSEDIFLVDCSAIGLLCQHRQLLSLSLRGSFHEMSFSNYDTSFQSVFPFPWQTIRDVQGDVDEYVRSLNPNYSFLCGSSNLDFRPCYRACFHLCDLPVACCQDSEQKPMPPTDVWHVVFPSTQQTGNQKSRRIS